MVSGGIRGNFTLGRAYRYDWPFDVCDDGKMKKLILFAVIAALAYGYFQYRGLSLPGPSSEMAAEIALQNAYANRQSDIQVKGAGKVTKLLNDDLDGSRHQRFIVMLGSGDTVLVSHNIDLAPRIDRHPMNGCVNSW